jgi:hypothetical protein
MANTAEPTASVERVLTGRLPTADSKVLGFIRQPPSPCVVCSCRDANRVDTEDDTEGDTEDDTEGDTEDDVKRDIKYIQDLQNNAVEIR